MRIRKRNRILRRIAVALALVALVVPAGRAKATPDAGRSYEPGAGAVVGVPHAGLNDYLKSRDGIEMVRLEPRSTLRGSDPIEKVRVASRVGSTPQSVASPGFDWGDAGILAGILGALGVLGGGAYVVSRHLGRPQTA
jgi:hypothetical protein